MHGAGFVSISAGADFYTPQEKTIHQRMRANPIKRLSVYKMREFHFSFL